MGLQAWGCCQTEVRSTSVETGCQKVWPGPMTQPVNALTALYGEANGGVNLLPWNVVDPSRDPQNI